MQNPSTEAEMVTVATERLKKMRLAFATEVPFLNRFIDLVYETSNGRLVAIEFKRRDWQRAIIQARDHLLGTPLVYVCLPTQLVSERIRVSLETEGLGLLGWSLQEPLQELRPPRETSSLTLETLTDWLRESFRHRLDCETQNDAT